MSLVICDYESYAPPLHALIVGPLTHRKDLLRLERLMRAFVLHDELHLHFPNTRETYLYGTMDKLLRGIGLLEEEAPRAVYKSTLYVSSPPAPPDLVAFESARSAGSAHFNPGSFTQAQSERLFNAVLAQGGSLLLDEDGVEHSIAEAATQFPKILFEKLDERWKDFARNSHLNGFNFAVPPVLSIVLNRCATREAVPKVLIDLRAEWRTARAHTWELLAEMRNARSLKQALTIESALADASELFCYRHKGPDDRPLRVFWELLGAAGAGAAVAAISAGKPITGALVGAAAYAGRAIPPLAHEFGPALFGRGAFDLARRVRRNTMLIEGDVLARLLSSSELDALT